MKHTKEPWEKIGNVWWDYDDSLAIGIECDKTPYDRHYLLHFVMPPKGVDHENIQNIAERFVATFQACKGIPTKALEDGVIGDLVSGMKKAEMAIGKPEEHRDGTWELGLASIVETALVKLKERG